MCKALFEIKCKVKKKGGNESGIIVFSDHGITNLSYNYTLRSWNNQFTLQLYPQGLLATLTANHVIALDKCPGVRPFGVGEIVRRILARQFFLLSSLMY